MAADGLYPDPACSHVCLHLNLPPVLGLRPDEARCHAELSFALLRVNQMVGQPAYDRQKWVMGRGELC